MKEKLLNNIKRRLFFLDLYLKGIKASDKLDQTTKDEQIKITEDVICKIEQQQIDVQNDKNIEIIAKEYEDDLK